MSCVVARYCYLLTNNWQRMKMAEIFLGAVAQQILGKVLSLAADEVSLAWSFEGELKRLSERVETIQGLLSDAESKQLSVTAVRLWLEKLEPVVYDAEDVLDDFEYEVLRRKVESGKRDKVRTFLSLSKNPLLFRHEMAHKIRNIILMLDKLCGEATAAQMGLVMKLVNNYVDPKKILDRKTHPALGDSKVVGRDKDMSVIVTKLVNSNHEKDLSVISIVGMPGQGKTTLAKQVYKDDLVIRTFHHRMWVCVSEDFDVTKLLNEMVESLTKGETSFHLSNIEAIIEKLKTFLMGKRYLLVLDDVWNEDPAKWESMKDSLKEIGASMGSKIMITTRNEKVASTMRTCLAYPLKRLSDEDSWTMFKQIAFANGGPIETKNLVDIGRKIVDSCKGLPLAVKTAGGLLYSKKSANEWGQMMDSLEHISGKVLLNLKLSYDNLESPSLKHCFASCSFFPKDSNIEKSKLIQIWIALGLLHPPKGNDLTMEDMGNYYFDTLLLNSLLQDAEKDGSGNIRSCKMHDLVHELALDIWEKSFWKSRALFLRDDFNGNKLTHFKRLRALVLVTNGIKPLQHSIGELKHLRYLHISHTNLNCMLPKLPENIVSLINLRNIYICGMVERQILTLGHLPFLEVIEISDARKVKLIGTEFYGKHIAGGGAIFPALRVLTLKFFLELEKWLECPLPSTRIVFPYLEKLTIHACSKLITLPSHFPSIKELDIFYISHSGALKEMSRKLTSLTSLYLDNVQGSEFQFVVEEFLGNNKSLRKLSFFHCDQLSYLPTHFDLKDLTIASCPKLTSVPNFVSLERLRIDFCHNLAIIGSLPSIRTLEINGCRNLTGLPSSNGAFPLIEELSIRNCFDLMSIPDLHYLASLRILRITNCNKLTICNTELCTSLDELLIEMRLTSAPSPDSHFPDLTLSELSEERDCFPWPSTSTSKADIQHLEQLRLAGRPNINSLPEQLQHLSSLVFLELYKFDGLEALPDWLGNLSRLVYLYITDCPNLKCMPLLESMKRLTQLRILRIFNCPLLTKMCLGRTRPEWDKISHIPKIQFKLKK